MPNHKRIQKRAISAGTRRAPTPARALGLAVRPDSLVKRWFQSLNLPVASSYAHPDLRKAAAARAKEALLQNSRVDSRVVLRSAPADVERFVGVGVGGSLSVESIGQDVYARVAPLLLDLESRRLCNSDCLEGLHEVTVRVLEWIVEYLPDRTTDEELDRQFATLEHLMGTLNERTWDAETERDLEAAKRMVDSLGSFGNRKPCELHWANDKEEDKSESRSRRELAELMCSYRAAADGLAVTWSDLGLRASDFEDEPLTCDDPTPIVVHLARQWAERWSELLTIDGRWAVRVFRAEAESRQLAFKRLAFDKRTLESIGSALDHDSARKAIHALHVTESVLCKVASVDNLHETERALTFPDHPLKPSVEGVADAVTFLVTKTLKYRNSIGTQLRNVLECVADEAVDSLQLNATERRTYDSLIWMKGLEDKGVAGLLLELVREQSRLDQLGKDLDELEGAKSKLVPEAKKAKDALARLNKELEEWCSA